MRREDDDALARELGEQRAEAHALLRIESRRRLVDDQQARIVEQRLRDADALAHAAGEAAERTVASLDEVHELEQLLDPRARRARLEALRGGEVLEELHRRELRVDAEVLGQVAQHLAHRVGLARDVGAVPRHASARRRRERREDAHERRLARAVGTEQPEHAGAEIERELRERPAAAGIALADTIDDELHGDLRERERSPPYAPPRRRVAARERRARSRATVRFSGSRSRGATASAPRCATAPSRSPARRAGPVRRDRPSGSAAIARSPHLRPRVARVVRPPRTRRA